ncbi:MAG: hypothetical protein L3J67_01350 [Hyphomicrobiaceae bacterium]|nr:hypothetical protein [Hyphomicrobiaceae bacterium]
MTPGSGLEVAIVKAADTHGDEFSELERLIKKARPIENEAHDLRLIHEAIRAEQQSAAIDDLRAAELTFAKWTVLHKYLYARPLRLPAGLSRPDQWGQVAKIYANLQDREIANWLALQIEIASNREKGFSDLRERRDGPCFLILLEYVGNRKRTALAVLHWAKAQ